MNHTGTCALCQTSNVTLLDSHIVSKWTYRRIVGYEPTAAPNPVMVAGGRSVLTSKQVKSYLLCQTCENLLSTRENYASQVGLQADSTFPALAAASVVEQKDGVELADIGTLDTDKLTHFAISVFWRADVAQIDPIVDLADAREPLRKYLVGETTLPTSCSLFVTLIRPDPTYPRIDRVVAFPATSDDGKRHDFVACGMRFTMYTQSAAPRALDQISCSGHKLVFISDGRSILNAVAAAVQASQAEGKLAQNASGK